MSTRTWLFAVLLGSGLASACLETRTVLDPDHCNSNDGDVFCAELYPDGSRPYCRLGNKVCSDAVGITEVDIDGCFAERPEDECYSACGEGKSIVEDPDCEGVAATTNSSTGPSTTDPTPGTSMSMSGDPTTDEGTDTEPTSGTTEGDGCEDDGDCPDPAMPFCDGAGACVDCDGMPDPGAACSELDANNPVCNEGECVQCTGAEADACDGQTPVCNDAENTCRACEEHSECPDSACHLDGGDVGACFDEGDVTTANTAAALVAAVNGLGAGDDLVVELSSGVDYNQTVNVAVDAEVAILGPATAELSGSAGQESLNVAGSGIVYVAGPSIAGNTAAEGVSCSGTSVWLDDSEVRNNAQIGLDISGGCAAHLRRTVVAVNNAGGIDQVGGELSIANSVVALNGASVSPFGGLSIDGVDVLVTYTTLAGNDSQNAGMSVRCSGANSGDVRNSIVVGEEANSIELCGGVSFSNNGVDDSGLGGSNDNVGAFDPGWFVNPAMGNYRLSSSGETTFMDIAMWQDSDPLADFEGDPIPTDMASFPGYDQP